MTTERAVSLVAHDRNVADATIRSTVQLTIVFAAERCPASAPMGAPVRGRCDRTARRAPLTEATVHGRLLCAGNQDHAG
jgi:hypothetical protein